MNSGGAPEAIRDGIDGFLVEDRPEAMAARTLELLADPAVYRRMAEEAKRGAASRVPDAVGTRIIRHYEELIAARQQQKSVRDRQTDSPSQRKQ